eukprot:2266744-Alexandrium_andersonii.AAC.1
MAGAVNFVAESSLLPEVLMAGRGSPSPYAAAALAAACGAASPLGRWGAPGAPAGSAALKPGMPGTWLL